MRGYLHKPDETVKAIADGWLHSRDVGIFDEDGYLRIVDRIKDMIIRGGENIYPKEIETALYGHEGVLEAPVVGRPDDVLGEVVAAYVAARRHHGRGPRRALHRLLATYKRPVLIEVLEELPTNAIGKIDKSALRSLASA